MAEEPRGGELLPVDPKAEWVDAFAPYVELIPLLGGVVSNVMNGWTQERRMRRVGEVISDFNRRMLALGDRLNETRRDYIRSDEFEDLVDRTLRQVTRERHEAKRLLYAAFLAGSVESAGGSYQEELRMLRTLDELQPDHIRVLKAIFEEPSLRHAMGGGANVFESVHRHMPDVPIGRVVDLVEQLADDLRLTMIGGVVAFTVTAGVEAEPPDRFTEYGWRFLKFIGLGERPTY